MERVALDVEYRLLAQTARSALMHCLMEYVIGADKRDRVGF